LLSETDGFTIKLKNCWKGEKRREELLNRYPPPFTKQKMPLQCELSWNEFQVDKIKNTGKQELLERCRPTRCPYCGSYSAFIGHGWELRYVILVNALIMLLLIPRYKCHYCGHTIRVLPVELHNHCLHIAQTIEEIIRNKLNCGRYMGKSRVPKYLQRHWFGLYEKRCQEYVNLHGDNDLRSFINRLPPFSVLFRSRYRTVWQHEPRILWIETHRRLPLIVCLDSS
jgi:DNA-directed RNA polymerase subunit RPC12/RpoP